MDLNREDETVADLLKMKARIEKNIASLQEEKDAIKQRLTQIKDLKQSERKKRAEEYIKNFRLKAALADELKRNEVRGAYMATLATHMKSMEVKIGNQMRLLDFEHPILQLRSAMEGAISFYGEDSLQMELMKRSNAVREKRVEYTRLESEINDLNRLAEERKREEERAKLAEIEKARKAEEYALRLEEEKALAEEARLRQHYLEVSSKPIETVQSFLSKDNMQTTGHHYTNGFAKPRSSNSNPSINESETASANQNGENQTPTSKSGVYANISFSQLLRW